MTGGEREDKEKVEEEEYSVGGIDLSHPLFDKVVQNLSDEGL